MNNNKEIEVKFILLNFEDIIKNLEKYKKVESEHQIDTYYVPSHRNFIMQKKITEWLRLRESSDHKYNINYKKWPEDITNAISCVEYETGILYIDAMKNILASLDFIEIIKVDKIRNTWLIDGIAVSVDVVNNLGTFIELESKNISDLDLFVEKYKKILNNIDAKVGEQNYKGYPYMLVEMKRNETNVNWLM